MTQTKHYTLWDIVEGVCPIHGKDAFALYVLNESGERITTFDGDSRKPEDTGQVFKECLSCQVTRWEQEKK